MVQLSHLCLTTRKTIALTIWIFVGKVMSALEYTAWVCHSFPSKEPASFNFVTAVTIHSDFGAQGNKICHCFHFSPYICHEVMGLDAMILVFLVLSFKPVFRSPHSILITRFQYFPWQS